MHAMNLGDRASDYMRKTYLHNINSSYFLPGTAGITRHSFHAYNSDELLVLHGYNPDSGAVYRIVAGFKKTTYADGGSTKTDVELVPITDQEEIRKFLAQTLRGPINFWQ